MTRLRLRPRPGGISAAAPVETTAASDRRPIAALVAVMLVFAALTSVVAVATPAWEAADEPSHVHNVETLVAGHWYRIPRHVSLKIPSELHQPPLYYALLAGFQRVAGRPVEPVTPGPVNFGFVRPFRHGFYKHHSAEQHRFLLLLRLPNVVLGLAAILLTFLTARAISGDAWTPAIAAAIVAFVPRFVFLSAFVTNDNLVNALGAALAYCTVRCVRAPGWRWAAAVGAVLGLLLITKVSALPVAAVLIPVALAAGTRKRRATVLAVAAAAVAALFAFQIYLHREPRARTSAA